MRTRNNRPGPRRRSIALALAGALIVLAALTVASGAPAQSLQQIQQNLNDSRSQLDQKQSQLQDAKDLLQRNSEDDNNAYMKVAERLIQQQDAAVASPTAIRANIPEQGRVLTFQRAVAVDPQADLQIGLKASAVKAASGGVRGLILALTLLVLGGFAWVSRALAKPA